MTNQEKVKFLSQYKTVRRKVDRLAAEIQDWRNMADVVSPGYSDMPKGTATSNPIETAVENIAEVEKELKQRIRELIRVRRRVDRAIRTVQDDTLREVLERRYISGMASEKIAEEMNYSPRWIKKLHGKAISKVDL